MTIRIIRTEQGRYAPVVHCDICGKRIEDAEDGIAVWFPDEGEQCKVQHVHKGRCDNIFRYGANHRGRPDGWDDLEIHLFRLLHNVKYNARQAKERTERLEEVFG